MCGSGHLLACHSQPLTFQECCKPVDIKWFLELSHGGNTYAKKLANTTTQAFGCSWRAPCYTFTDTPPCYRTKPYTYGHLAFSRVATPVEGEAVRLFPKEAIIIPNSGYIPTSLWG